MTDTSELEEYFEKTLDEFMRKRSELMAVEAYMQFVRDRELNPHCDNQILHSPGKCKYCDDHPDAQTYRKMLHLKFTDEMSEGDSVLPGGERTKARAERWGGNQAKE